MKTLCKWSSKDILKHLEKLSAVTDEAQYACKKCARVCNSKKGLCKPVALPARVMSF